MKHNSFPILLFAGLVPLFLAARTFNKVIVDNPDALCLDGSKGAYYISEGKESTKFLLSFEGGGWCESSASLAQTLESCYTRSKTDLGSTSAYPATISFSTGILSDVPQNYFKDWTIVHLKYCDGTGHQGYKKDAVLYKDTNLFFRGHNVTQAQLNSIDQKNKMFTKATNIVVTGQSAGGLAAFLWTNYIVDRAPMGAKVRSIPDSGIFLDSPNLSSHLYSYRTGFQNFMKLANEEIDPPTSQCVMANPNEKWKCLFAEHIHSHIKVPLFAIESAYDSWSIHYILGIPCQSGGSFASCDSAQLDYIEQYHTNTSKVLMEIGLKDANGFWSPSCSNHVYSPFAAYTSAAFRIPAESEYSLALCVENWMTSKDVSHQHMDNVKWPNNKPCSGVTQKSLITS